MWADALNILGGLAIGLISGFFFEHRALSQARHHARELEEELRILRESIYSVGGQVRPRKEPEPPSEQLASSIHQWISDYQDYQGRVARARITSHFVSQGHSGRDVEASLVALAESGSVAFNERWVELR